MRASQGEHPVRYYRWYSNSSRGKRKRTPGQIPVVAPEDIIQVPRRAPTRPRKQRRAHHIMQINEADPLNLVGILTPGSRVSPLSGQAIPYVDGAPLEIGERHALQTTARRRSQMVS